MGLNGSVAAMRAGMMKHDGVPTFPSAIGNFEYGRLSLQRKVRASTATSSSWIALIIRPMLSRACQRARLRIPSFARTGSPSWNFRFGRSRKVQAVARHFLGFNHLPLRLQVGVHAIEHVP